MLGAGALCVAHLSAPASAQTLITPDAFLDAVVGKTVSFHEMRSGFLVGTERFLSPNLSVWRRNGEGCVYGQITTPGRQICFLYDDDPDGIPVCWWPFAHEGHLLVRLATFSESEIQRVSNIDVDGLDCPSTPIS